MQEYFVLFQIFKSISMFNHIWIEILNLGFDFFKHFFFVLPFLLLFLSGWFQLLCFIIVIHYIRPDDPFVIVKKFCRVFKCFLFPVQFFTEQIDLTFNSIMRKLDQEHFLFLLHEFKGILASCVLGVLHSRLANVFRLIDDVLILHCVECFIRICWRDVLIFKLILMVQWGWRLKPKGEIVFSMSQCSCPKSWDFSLFPLPQSFFASLCLLPRRHLCRLASGTVILSLSCRLQVAFI